MANPTAGLCSRHGEVAIVPWQDLFGAKVHTKGSQRDMAQTFIFIPVIPIGLNFQSVIPRMNG